MKALSFFAFVLMIFAVSCSGNDYGDKVMEGTLSPADFSGQKPMTQKDIDIYVELIPESAAFTDNYMTGTITDKPLAIETFKKHGVDRRRYLFLTHKVFYAMLSSSGISFKIPDSFPKSMRVTEEDVELVSLNKDRILHANGKYYDNKHM